MFAYIKQLFAEALLLEGREDQELADPSSAPISPEVPELVGRRTAHRHICAFLRPWDLNLLVQHVVRPVWVEMDERESIYKEQKN